MTCFLASCATNPLEYGYRPSPGVPKREWQNNSPALSQTSVSGHNASVNSYLRRGYRIIGYGQVNARYNIDSENARMLAIQKNADAAVFSRSGPSKHSERVAVPIATTASSGQASSYYGNSNQYQSQSQAQASGQTTVYGYQDQAYQVWNHKTTLLRKN